MFFLNQRKNFYNSPNIHYFFSYTISPILILFTANKRVSNFINRFISVWWTSIIPKKKEKYQNPSILALYVNICITLNIIPGIGTITTNKASLFTGRRFISLDFRTTRKSGPLWGKSTPPREKLTSPTVKPRKSIVCFF